MLNPEIYNQYYCECQQSGGAYLPVYSGTLIQRGGGLGSIFSSIFRSVAPLLKTGARASGKAALRSGKALMKDFSKVEFEETRKEGAEATCIRSDRTYNIPPPSSKRPKEKQRLASEAIHHITSPPSSKRKKEKAHQTFLVKTVW